ncbi:MAG TPA: restriction endonuclease subunit S [Tissierellaceae bacterium]
MADILVPEQVEIKDIITKKHNFSPANYKKVDVKAPNQVKLHNLLDSDVPFIRGTEPGSSAYLKDLKSNMKFIRNSCVDKLNNIVQLQRSLYLNEKSTTFNQEQLLQNGDIVVATEANIGDSALFHTDEKKYSYLLSSGMVKLNINKNVNKYYLLAMLEDGYFFSQLDSMTPKGSTIRHSGSRLLDCRIPYPKEKDLWIIPIIENLMRNIIFAEKRAQKIQDEITYIFDGEFRCISVNEKEPKVSDLLSVKRVDAGYYSQKVQRFFEKIEKHPNGSKKLAELGYKTRRGPNLAKRDLGRSIKTDIFHPNYALLVYPSDISDFGIIDKTTFLGAAGKIWYLEEKDILFSAEGNVGKTFAICDNSLKFTTNFHGIIITPINKDKVDIQHTIFISTFLNYMKRKGIIDKLSVGGQGGSFAVQYWDMLRFPNLNDDILTKIKKLYYSRYQIYPFDFNEEDIDKLGIYEVNKLRTLCVSLLKVMLNDIKNDKIKEKSFYLKQLEQLI